MARGSEARWWLAMGVLMMVIAYCRTAEVTTDDDEIMARQTRGLVLRSWRNSQQQQAEQSADKNPSTKMVDPNLPTPKEAMVFSGLPISMKLVLLQRLAGYDKRTPNSRAFLGMRGKKSSSTQGNVQREEDNQFDAEGSSEGDKIAELEFYDLVPEKRKMHGEKFLGMRGKKMANGLAAGAAFIPNWRERYVYQQAFQKKRAPSSNSFMGMRGKRSEVVMPAVDNQLFNDEHPSLYQERFQSK